MLRGISWRHINRPNTISSTSKRRVLPHSCFALLMCLCAMSGVPKLSAQVSTASLSGIVTDASGAPIAGAEVTLKNTQQTASRSAKTGSSGEYVISALQPGTYAITVRATGFQDHMTQSFALSAEQTATLNVNLSVAGTSTNVTVEASAPLLQTTSASVGTAVSAKQMNDLPILGGSFLNAVALAPGTIPLSPPGSLLNFSPVSQFTIPSVFGQRQKDNDYLLDGVVNRDPNFLGVALFPPPAAIAEMKVDSGVGSSVYGHGSGATINIVTKSGTNQWHGEAYEYFRNNVLDARSFFLPSVGAYRWNQFGAAIGGPIQIPHLLSKDKGWYVFGNYEGVRIVTAANFTGYVPSQSNLNGDYSASATRLYDPYSTVAGSNGTQVRTQFPGNIIPASRLNPTTLALAKAVYPAPNLATGVIPGVNYINTTPTTRNGDQWNARVDHQFGQRDNFFARYTGANNPSNSLSLPTQVSTTSQTLANVNVSDTHILSPSFLFTAHYGLMWIDYNTNTPAPAGLTTSSGIGSAFGTYQGSETIPSVNIPGYSAFSFTHSIMPSMQNSWSGDAQKVIGEHTLEFGGGVSTTHLRTSDNGDSTLQFSALQTASGASVGGDAFASFLLGAPSSARRLIGSNEGNMHATEYAWYIQDTWRHGPLTLNFGVRYDYATVPVNSNGLGTFDWGTGQFVWDQKNPITGAAANIQSGGAPPDANNFAPRLGIAYQVTPRTVIRSSFGLFYNTFGSNFIQGTQGARGNWPFAFPQALTGMNTGIPNALMPNPFGATPAGSSVPLACNQCLNVDRDSTRTPYVAEWTFSIQRKIGSDISVEADYFGSKAVKLTSQIVDNTAAYPGPGPIASRQLFPQLAPYVLNNYNEMPAWYDAATLQVSKRLSHGLQFQANYTYSKNIDLVDNISNAGLGTQPTSNPTRFNFGLNKGPAGFDIRHVVVGNAVWAIPGKTSHAFLNAVISNWNLSGITTFHSGLPFMIFLPTDNENIGQVSGRYTEFPNLVGDPRAVNQTVARWFNTQAFSTPAPYTRGNLGRNILRTDTQITTDLSLYKTWPFLESRSVELRGDFFNLFNHANFGYPGTTLGTSQFGAIASTLNPGRQVQLAVKIHF
jgi:hypothetical protein